MNGTFAPFTGNGRFYLERQDLDDGTEWLVVDAHTAKVVGAPTKTEATAMAAFAREYVRRHGDIDLGVFPCDIGQTLRYEDDDENDERPWRIDGGKVVPHGPSPVPEARARFWTRRFRARWPHLRA